MSSDLRWLLNRRAFLQVGGGSVGALSAWSSVDAEDFNYPFPIHRFRVRRDLDLLSLEFTFQNFARIGEELVALGGRQSRVIVRFPPQNLAEARFDKAAEPRTEEECKTALEEAFSRNTSSVPSGEFEEFPIFAENGAQRAQPPVAAYLSGPSWIAFNAPDNARVPLSLQAAEKLWWKCKGPAYAPGNVVDYWVQMLGHWQVHVPRNALIPGKPVFPAPDETCLEIPFRIFMAPSTETAKWLTSSELRLPFAGPGSGAVELWHAAMHDRSKLKPAELPSDLTNVPPELQPPKEVTSQSRAVFSPDWRPNGEPDQNLFYPGKVPLSHRAKDRHDLVQQISEGDGWIDASHLILSALGADADLHYSMQKTFREIYDAQISGKNTPNPSGRLAIWKHRMVVGRDVFLLSVRTGFLMPFAFPALLVESTRRTFTSIKDRMNSRVSSPGAFLLTEYFILVQDGERRYGEPNNVISRKMPIKRATMLEKRSPLIQPPTKSELFVPKLLSNSAVLRWPMEFEDGSGKVIRTTDACLLFAGHVLRGQEAWQLLPESLTSWSLPGNKFALAPDKAAIKLTLPKSVSVSTLMQPASVDSEFHHEFADAERRLVRKLSEVARAAKANPLNALRDKLQSVSDEYRGLTQETKAKLLRAIDLIDQVGSTKDELSNELIRQLEQVEQANTDVELHKIQLGCRVTAQSLKLKFDEITQRIQTATDTATLQSSIKAYLENAMQSVPAVEAEALAKAATAAEDVLKQAGFETLAAIQGAPEKLIQALADKAQVGKELIEQQLRMLSEHASSLDELKSQFKKLAEVKSTELETVTNEVKHLLDKQGDLSKAKSDLTRYFSGIADEAKVAERAFRHGIQPQMDKAKVIVPALRAMGGQLPPQQLSLFEDYALKGISQVQNSVFAAFDEPIDEGKAMINSVQNAVAAPAAVVAGLSRDIGAVVGQAREDVEKLGRPIDPSSDVVSEIVRKAIPDTKILGVLSMQQLVRKILGAADVPTISLKELPDHVEQVWEWNTQIADDVKFFGILDFLVLPAPLGSSGGGGPGGGPGPDNKPPLHLYIRTTTKLSVKGPGTADDLQNTAQSAKGRVELVGNLAIWDRVAKKPQTPSERDAFALELFGLIRVGFRELSFHAEYEKGEKPNPKLEPKLGNIDFLPPLDFVAKLQKMIPFLGEGFRVVQEPGRIGIRYTFNIPGIAFGAFSMRNISIGSALMFSLEGKPLRFDFNFSTWEQPFELTVMCFGGRGFLKISLDTSGFKELQGAIEFGGALSFDVAVASGGLYVMAGIYFRINSNLTDVSGYLRAGGCVNVLGLIHASVEFLLMMKYLKKGNETFLAGIARVTVSIDLFLVSFDVEVEMYKEIPGGGGGGSSNNAYLPHSGAARYVSFLQQNATTQFPRAYFTRETPAVRTKGRFDSPQDWARDYWSQFAL